MLLLMREALAEVPRAARALTLCALLLGCANAPQTPPSPAALSAVDLANPRPVIAVKDAVKLRGHWFPAPGDGARPTVLALHGCSGLYLRDGKTFDRRYPDFVARLNRSGYNVLLTDSFGSRGSGPICTKKLNERRITVDDRREDVIAAVSWLAARPDVDAKRIALLGWSHGGSTTLAALNAARAEHAQPLAGAVAFYPGCRAFLPDPYRLDTPLLMLLAEKDDWTPPRHCEQLAGRIRAAQPTADLAVKVFPDSYHGFDGKAALRLRADVSNGVNPAGVHVGGNPVTGPQALQQMDEFFARIFK
jgi:dienelactone hydrolase